MICMKPSKDEERGENQLYAKKCWQKQWLREIRHWVYQLKIKKLSIFRNYIKTDRKCRRKFLINMVWRGCKGFLRFRRRKKKGLLFPAFQFISVTNDCNLRCQGCWVSTSGHKEYMHPEKIQTIIDAGKRQGSYFFGILGGEPLMYKQLTGIFKDNPDCYFQLFTNGTLFDEKIAQQLRESGNVSPLFSFEG